MRTTRKTEAALRILAEKIPDPGWMFGEDFTVWDLRKEMQRFGYKWYPHIQKWKFTHYVYHNLPEHIYTRTQLKEINRVPKKGAREFWCWNGIGFLPVWDIADTREKRKITEKQRLALEKCRKRQQDERQIYHFLGLDHPVVVYEKWIYFTLPKIFTVISK